jgi:hypothetical protein
METAKRIAFYTGCLAFCIACWWGVFKLVAAVF